MADMRFIAQTSEVSLTTATAKTVLQVIAPLNQRVKILGWGVFFDGTSTTAEPAQIRLLRQTTAGTMSALTPAVQGVYSETLQSTAQHTATVEPTAGNVIDIAEAHTQGGYEVKYPIGQEPILPSEGRIGIEVTATFSGSLACRAKLICEEGGVIFVVGNTTPISTGTGLKTIALADAEINQRVKILGWEVSFAGNSVTGEPVTCHLMRTSNAGSMNSSSPRKLTTGGETLQTDGFVNTDGGVTEPTYTVSSDSLDTVLVHPQSGYSVRYPYGQEPIIPGGGFAGIVVNSTESIGCVAKLICEE